jgi:hypothetical protein
MDDEGDTSAGTAALALFRRRPLGGPLVDFIVLLLLSTTGTYSSLLSRNCFLCRLLQSGIVHELLLMRPMLRLLPRTLLSLLLFQTATVAVARCCRCRSCVSLSLVSYHPHGATMI